MKKIICAFLLCSFAIIISSSVADGHQLSYPFGISGNMTLGETKSAIESIFGESEDNSYEKYISFSVKPENMFFDGLEIYNVSVEEYNSEGWIIKLDLYERDFNMLESHLISLYKTLRSEFGLPISISPMRESVSFDGSKKTIIVFDNQELLESDIKNAIDSLDYALVWKNASCNISIYNLYSEKNCHVIMQFNQHEIAGK